MVRVVAGADLLRPEAKPCMTHVGDAISVVIPAHNEATVIGRLLNALGDRRPGDEVIVVCDGCTDQTAAIASGYPGITVVEQARGGKPAALNAGDCLAKIFPRFYVDADISVTMAVLREVASAMEKGVEAGAPRLALDLVGASWLVRGYYDVWRRFPYASGSVLGSGVVGLTKVGRERFDLFPNFINDDEFVRRLFDVDERVATSDGFFVVTTPRNARSLVRIKTRSELGTLQLDVALGPQRKSVGMHGSSIFRGLLRDPRHWSSVAIFVSIRSVVGLRAHLKMRRGEFAGWARDETARS